MRSLAFVLPILALACNKTDDTETGQVSDTDTAADTDADTDSDADTDPDENADWDWDAMVPDQGTAWVFRNTVTGEEFPATILEDEEVDGDTYTPFAIGDMGSTAAERFLIDFDFSQPFVLGVKRMAWFWAGEARPFEDYTLTPPLPMPLLDQVGASETHEAEGTMNGTDTLTVTVTTTLLEKGVSVTVPMGTIDNCRHYSTEIEMGFTVPIEVWIHNEYAFVKSTDFIGGAQWELVSFDPAG